MAEKEDLIATLDQFATNLENFSTLMATYYKSLIADGVHDELAQKLVCELNRVLFSGADQSRRPRDE